MDETEYRVAKRWTFGKWQYFPEYKKIKKKLFRKNTVRWRNIIAYPFLLSFNSEEKAWDYIKNPDKYKELHKSSHSEIRKY